MREYPILFSGQMIPPLIDGRKRVTRRLSKQWLKVRAGDRLWVREMTESYPLPNLLTGEPTNAICGRYSADHEPVLDEHEFDIAWWYSKPVCPSIHMPRWASRILLECEEDARLERLQDITEEEAKLEGIDVGSRASDPEASPNICVNCGQHRKQHVGVAQVCFGSCGELFSTRTFRGGFAFLWDTLHTKTGERWEENPAVIRLRFRRI